ncbi:MAG: enoyl-CoA hydratase-related protein [Myxococcota bacterium]
MSEAAGFSSEVLSIEKNGPVGTLWMDRPEKYNAMNPAMWRGLPGAMQALTADGDVGAIVLSAKGKHFSVGLDLVSAQSGGDGTLGGSLSGAAANLKQLEVTRAFQAAISSIADSPVPVIAAIHGYCLGAGVDVATACDIRLAAKDSTFSIRETKIGIVADVGTLQRLPKIVTAGHVAELAYTGKDIDAARAEKIGLLNDVHADAESTYQAAFEMAMEIANNAPLAVRGTKFVLSQSEDLTTEQSLLLNGIWTMITTLNSNDLKEAMTAFMEKRPPQFKGE